MFLPKPKRINQFLNDETGTVSPLAIYLIFSILLFSGISLDSTNSFKMRYILQSAADAAAHAAVMDLPDPDTALATALSYANYNLTSDSQNSSVTSSDVQIGVWDPDARTFTETNTDADAVRVTASRTAANANALPTFLLFIAGIESWDISVSAVAYRSGAPGSQCETGDGVITDGIFSTTSNNEFHGTYCVHAGQGISLNNNNNFDDDNILSVGSFSDISWPSSTGFSTVVGRGDADSSATLTYQDVFQEDDLASPFVSDVDALADDFLDPLYAGQPSYINSSSSVINITAKAVKYTDFIPEMVGR